MKARSVCGVFAVLVGAVGCGSSPGVTEPPDEWTLVFEDDFETGDMPSPEIWNYDTGYEGPGSPVGWGNDEAQLYTDSPENVRVEDGNLVIVARCPVTPCGSRDGSVTSGRITTRGKIETRYGRVEAKVKLPAGDGLWPAFWMLGASFPETAWPRCGEIDIMEFVGSRDTVVLGSLHGPQYSGAESFSRETELPDEESFADEFHVFTVDWDPGRIAFRVDGELYQTRTSSEINAEGTWVFDDAFFMLLNVAVGGNVGGSFPPNVAFEHEMLVDYVRIYERAQ
jgi:beta-glucanase (GH16 family)